MTGGASFDDMFGPLLKHMWEEAVKEEKARKPKTYTVNLDGFEPVITDSDGNRLTDKEYVDFVGKLTESRKAYIYIASGLHPKTKQPCHKIGLSINPQTRLEKIGFTAIHLIQCRYAFRRSSEGLLHGCFIERGRWIDREYFNLTDADIALIKTIDNAALIERVLQPRWYWGHGFNPYQIWEIEEMYVRMKKEGFESLTDYIDSLYDRELPEKATRREELTERWLQSRVIEVVNRDWDELMP